MQHHWVKVKRYLDSNYFKNVVLQKGTISSIEFFTKLGFCKHTELAHFLQGTRHVV